MKKRVYLSPSAEPEVIRDADILTLSLGSQSNDLNVDQAGSFDEFEF